jgi:Flp pilus assembly protein TadG
MRNRFKARWHRWRRGQGLVEFAIILPILVLIVLGTIDFGRVLFSWIQVMNAAREGAAYAAFNPNDSGGIQLRVDQETNAQSQRGEGTQTISVTCNRADNGATVPCDAAFVAGLGSTITVKVSEEFTFLTPLVNSLFPDFIMSAAATTFYMVPPNGTGPVVTPTPTASPSPTPTPSASASASGSASGSASASASASATATPTPTPVPTATCTVPNFTAQGGVRSEQVVSTWTAAGFQAANITNNVPSGKKAKSQSLGAGTTQPCFTATIIVN